MSAHLASQSSRNSSSNTSNSSAPVGWTLYYSNEGYPYFFNPVTQESVWAEVNSGLDQPSFPRANANSNDSGSTSVTSSTNNNKIQKPKLAKPTEMPSNTSERNDDDDTSSSDNSEDSEHSSDDDVDATDDDEIENSFIEYIKSPSGIEAVEEEQSRIAEIIKAKEMKQQKKMNVRLLRQQARFKRKQDGLILESDTESDSTESSSDNSLSSDDSDLQEALEPLFPPVNELYQSLLRLIRRETPSAEDRGVPLSARKRYIQAAADAYSKTRSSWMTWLVEMTSFAVQQTVTFMVGGASRTIQALVTNPVAESAIPLPSADTIGINTDPTTLAHSQVEPLSTRSNSKKARKWTRG